MWFVKYDELNMKKWLKILKIFQISVHNFLKSSWKCPMKKCLLAATRYPPQIRINAFYPTRLEDVLEKNCFVKIFSHFSKKFFHGSKNLKQKAFSIEILNWFRENISKSSTYFNNETFLPKFIFHRNFLFEKGKKF